MKKQAGFTLIELIMVIVILGVLSAFALPRFADLGQQARTATIQGAAGAIRSAANIAHAQALAENDADNSVTLEGIAIAMVNSYPQALATGGILAAAQIDANDYTLVTTSAGSTATSEVAIQAKGATTAANCQVTYNAADANASPVINVMTTGC